VTQGILNMSDYGIRVAPNGSNRLAQEPLEK
jgi:hypothetical protein